MSYNRGPLCRYEQLGALRGIASFQVLISHTMLTAPLLYASTVDFVQTLQFQRSSNGLEQLAFYLTYTPLHFFWLGGPAVIFFFVLSGFVLASSLKGKLGVGGYTQYLIKRLFRLYIPFILTIILSIACRQVFFRNANEISGLTEWFKGIWYHPITLKEFTGLITFKNRNFHNIVTTLWSIEIEIKLSIIVPILLLITRLCDRFVILKHLWNITLWIIAWGISHNTAKYFNNDVHIVYDRFVVHQILPFMTGIMIFTYSDPLIRAFEKLRKVEVFILLIAAVLIHNIYWIAWKLWYIDLFNPMFVFEEDMLVVSSALFIMLSFNPLIKKVLLHRILIFSGKISYSLYLTHPIIIAIMIYTFIDYIPLAAIWILIFALSILLANITYQYMENPINNFGRKIAKKIPIRGQKKAIRL